jgi:hypothetical protein
MFMFMFCTAFLLQLQKHFMLPANALMHHKLADPTAHVHEACTP